MPLGLSGASGPTWCPAGGVREAHEDGADELAEGGGVDRLQLLFLAAAGSGSTGCSAAGLAASREVIQEPLDLGPESMK